MKKVIYLAILPAVFSLVWYLSVEVVYAKVYQSPKNDREKSFKSASPVAVLGEDKPNSDVRTRSEHTLPENLTGQIETDNTTNLDILNENKTSQNSPEIKPKLRVVLDPGHGGKDDKAKVNGVYEKDLNLDVAREIKKRLQEKGFEVTMTREDDSFVPLFTRAAAKGDIFISIHADKAPLNGRGRYNGMNIYTGNMMPKDPSLLDKSMILAKAFQSELGKIAGIKMSDEIKQLSSMVLRVNTSPAIIVEMGYMTDEDDLKFMLNKDNHKKMANAFADAIEAYQ